MEEKTPSPKKKTTDNVLQRLKDHFLNRDFEWRGGPNLLFILSKIVGFDVCRLTSVQCVLEQSTRSLKYVTPLAGNLSYPGGKSMSRLFHFVRVARSLKLASRSPVILLLLPLLSSTYKDDSSKWSRFP